MSGMYLLPQYLADTFYHISIRQERDRGGAGEIMLLFAPSILITSADTVHIHYSLRECVRNLDLGVQVHPGDLWVSKQLVHIVLQASKSAGAKGDVPKICGFVNPLHPL